MEQLLAHIEWAGVHKRSSQKIIDLSLVLGLFPGEKGLKALMTLHLLGADPLQSVEGTFMEEAGL